VVRQLRLDAPRREAVIMNAFTVAILRACRGSCDCEVCQLLREVSRVMEESLLEGLRR